MKGSTRFLVLCTMLLGALLAGLGAPKLHVSVIDVGQGDAILVQFPAGVAMLVDAGEKAAGPVVVKYLKSRGINKLDILVVTHPHADHIGGMPDVLKAFPVGRVWDSGYNQGSRTQQDFLALVKKQGLQYGKPKRGFTRDIGAVHLAVLAPGERFLTGTNSDANNNSLVLRFTYDQVSILLAGDMEREAREAWGPWPRSTVLKVSHHGSDNGTDKDFARMVAPRFAIFSYGKNSYGHPHRDAVNALAGVGAKLYSTHQNGTVIVTTEGKSVAVTALGKAKTKRSDSSAASAGGTASSGDDIVYITRTGSKYHRDGCRYLARSRIPITRREAIARGYTPCSVCKP
ncbi:MAG: ComEC/Rec2 family competence protein [Armatimonadota bacterium]